MTLKGFLYILCSAYWVFRLPSFRWINKSKIHVKNGSVIIFVVMQPKYNLKIYIGKLTLHSSEATGMWPRKLTLKFMTKFK